MLAGMSQIFLTHGNDKNFQPEFPLAKNRLKLGSNSLN